MPRVTFVYPSVGRFPDTRYVRSWQMQPLSIAVLSALTPPAWERSFYDDRLEEIDYAAPCDLAAISIETYTARRGYQVAAEYRRRGVPVVMGGYHATFRPDEVLRHADAVCVGEAEPLWARMLADAGRGALAGRYESDRTAPSRYAGYDRTIFDGKKYLDLALVETGRGCGFDCTFCSITAFHRRRYKPRPTAEVVAEVRALREKTVFFVDDNIVGDFRRARDLFTALRGSGVRWMGQASINAARSPELLALMAESGCAGLLVGFESLTAEGLACVNKPVNRSVDYGAAMDAFRRSGIVIYGTFMFGLPTDTPQSAREAVAFALRHRMFMAAFNHVVPFPGTPLYAELEAGGRLTHPAWWLSSDFRFGDSPFRPRDGTPEELRERCHEARCDFYRMSSILRRALDRRANCRSLHRAGLYFLLNFLLRREIRLKRGLPLGVRDDPRETRRAPAEEGVVEPVAAAGEKTT